MISSLIMPTLILLLFRCTVIAEDSLVTSDRSSTADYFLCGQLNDPVFGTSQAEIFSLFRLSGLNPELQGCECRFDRYVFAL